MSKGRNSSTVTIRLTDSQIQFLESQARERQSSVGVLIRDLVVGWIDKKLASRSVHTMTGEPTGSPNGGNSGQIRSVHTMTKRVIPLTLGAVHYRSECVYAVGQVVVKHSSGGMEFRRKILGYDDTGEPILGAVHG